MVVNAAGHETFRGRRKLGQGHLLRRRHAWLRAPVSKLTAAVHLAPASYTALGGRGGGQDHGQDPIVNGILHVRKFSTVDIVQLMATILDTAETAMPGARREPLLLVLEYPL
jgi:hypothetical protein